MAPWLLIDAYNLAFRAFYGIPELTRSDGFPTNAIHGWVRTLWWLEDHQKPEQMVLIYDLGEPKRRTELLPQYKAQRGETPEGLSQQIPVLKAIGKAMGFGQVEQEGMEADDLIAQWADALNRDGKTVSIVSSDKDLAQSIRPGISQLLPPPTANPKLGWRELDEVGVRAKFGVDPSQIPDYLALIGDTSDNIPGLTGVGPKTAALWLEQYHTLEKVIANAGRLKPPRFQNLVHQSADRLRTNLSLTRLDKADEAPLPDIAPAKPQALLDLLTEYEMPRSYDEACKRYTA